MGRGCGEERDHDRAADRHPGSVQGRAGADRRSRWEDPGLRCAQCGHGQGVPRERRSSQGGRRDRREGEADPGRVAREAPGRVREQDLGRALPWSGNCKRCHEEQYKTWSLTPHAHAFATLEKDKKHDDPNCVKCHVTGGEDPDGYAANRTTPDLRNVGCEVCHGKGTEHDRTTPLAITEAMCRNCHQGEFEKGFNFAAALPLVSH
ncbi:MAG: cytochrome c family protein [Candidatus Eisenbacteria bacterium]|nr:cytochrome c family protein [Candidatus Eisenbacteria bacterium]